MTKSSITASRLIPHRGTHFHGFSWCSRCLRLSK